MRGTVWVDGAADARVASMRVGGMTVLERALREAARAGATRALVPTDAEVPTVPGLAIDAVAPGAAPPADAERIAGDVIAGVRITDEPSRRRAERALLETCRRSYDGIGDRYVIRAVSLRLTRVLAAMRLTPNQVTIANIFVGLAACACAAVGTWPGFLAAGLLMWLQVVLDSCDGEVARLRLMGSRFGMWLDNVSDDVIDNLFVAALGVGLGGPWVAVGAAAALLRGAVAVMIYRAVARAGHPGDVMAFHWWFAVPEAEGVVREPPRLTPLALAQSLGRRDLYTLVWGASCVASVPFVAFGLGVTICVGYVVLGILHATRS